MLVDLRIYTVRPGQLENFVALYRDYAWPLQQKYLGRCLGWYTTAEGSSIRSCTSGPMTARPIVKRGAAKMASDPGWREYLKRSSEAGLLVAQENRFLKPTEFFQAK